MDQEQEQVLEKYFSEGIVKGGDFLLTPEKMLSFIDALTKVGVFVVGCELWRYLDPHKDPRRVLELAGAGMLVEDPPPPEILTPEMCANQVKNFIVNQWPEDADLVALIFLGSEIYDYFRAKSKMILDEFWRDNSTSI